MSSSWTELQAWFSGNPRQASAALVLLTALAALASLYLARKVLAGGIHHLVRRTSARWDDILVERGVFDTLSYLAPALIIYASIYWFAREAEPSMVRLLKAYTLIIFSLVLSKLLTSINEIYATTSMGKELPIKGYVQVVKLILFIATATLVLAVLLQQSVLAFLSGIGAATAVLLLIFKDTILSLVASIQLATNEMVRIGDWIEMPKYDANGEVVDIALHTVKVQNFDLTITTIPTFKLIEDSFKNWRSMRERGARRIKRAVLIDQTSVRFLDDPTIARLERIQLLAEYLRTMRQELERTNRESGADQSMMVNGRRMTNIGTFRVYLMAYLRANPRIRQDMSALVRQLDPGPNGVPLEIYAFAAETRWEDFEIIQSDIFDHVLAVVPEFGLRVFQSPTGQDMARGDGPPS